MEIKGFKIHVALIIFVLILGLGLTGEYYVRHTRVTVPLTRQIEETPGVQDIEFVSGKQNTKIRVTLGESAELSEVVKSIRSVITDFGGQYAIQLVDAPSQTSLRAFDKMQFVIEEAIASGTFTEMERETQDLAEAFNLDLQIALDREYVYVSLIDGDSTLYRVIARGQAPQIATIRQAGEVTT